MVYFKINFNNIMGKSRMMGAGHASSTLYKCSPNLPSGGGNKKQRDYFKSWVKQLGKS
jgi:hypothetical protein